MKDETMNNPGMPESKLIPCKSIKRSDPMMNKGALLLYFEEAWRSSLIGTYENEEMKQAYKQIKSLIENQPEVDEEFIEKWADEIEQQGWKRFGAPIKFMDYHDLITHLLQEAGVKIIKK